MRGPPTRPTLRLDPPPHQASFYFSLFSDLNMRRVFVSFVCLLLLRQKPNMSCQEDRFLHKNENVFIKSQRVNKQVHKNTRGFWFVTLRGGNFSILFFKTEENLPNFGHMIYLRKLFFTFGKVCAFCFSHITWFILRHCVLSCIWQHVKLFMQKPVEVE